MQVYFHFRIRRLIVNVMFDFMSVLLIIPKNVFIVYFCLEQLIHVRPVYMRKKTKQTLRFFSLFGEILK